LYLSFNGWWICWSIPKNDFAQI
ncbi:uncharacterized protein METZ01_LOCUS466928, partial [marine metagenome]